LSPEAAFVKLRAAFVSLAILLLAPALALAGTLCGTVTDSQSGAPVAAAGIFLRTQAGAYTGIYGATDATGHFCIASVPAGTYDLEVRVDDEQVAYVRGVIVTASSTDVGIGLGRTLAFARPAPDPARTTTQLRWSLPASARVQLAILDISGRALRRWGDDRAAAGSHALTWDLRDGSGHRVAPGIYFARLEAGGRRLVRSIVVVR
jgi:carboxypeptidase family protein/flagellar hook capping protein FlgD